MTNKQLIKELLDAGPKSELRAFLSNDRSSPDRWAEKSEFKGTSSELKKNLVDALSTFVTLGTPDQKAKNALHHGAWIKQTIAHITKDIENGTIKEASEGKDHFTKLFDAFKTELNNQLENKDEVKAFEACKSPEELLPKLEEVNRIVALNSFYHHPTLEKGTQVLCQGAPKEIAATLAAVKYQPLSDLIDATINTLRNHKATDKTAIMLVQICRILHEHMRKLSGKTMSQAECYESLVNHLRGMKNYTKKRLVFRGKYSHNYHDENCAALSNLIRDVLLEQHPQYQLKKGTGVLPKTEEISTIENLMPPHARKDSKKTNSHSEENKKPEFNRRGS